MRAWLPWFGIFSGPDAPKEAPDYRIDAPIGAPIKIKVPEAYAMTDRDRTLKAFHPSTFQYLKPTDEQLAQMQALREATATYAGELDAALPEGPDKTYIMRSLRTLAMWVNVCVTRRADGTPRSEIDHDA
jgi:hypothetical protein